MSHPVGGFYADTALGVTGLTAQMLPRTLLT